MPEVEEQAVNYGPSEVWLNIYIFISLSEPGIALLISKQISSIQWNNLSYLAYKITCYPFTLMSAFEEKIKIAFCMQISVN